MCTCEKCGGEKVRANIHALPRCPKCDNGKCPQFIIDRMERLKKLPPPTREQVATQMASSIRIRKEMMGKDVLACGCSPDSLCDCPENGDPVEEDTGRDHYEAHCKHCGHTTCFVDEREDGVIECVHCGMEIDFKSPDVEEDISKRWEQGMSHHARSREVYDMLVEADNRYGGDYFCWKSGGDGDNGETLMFMLDVYFEKRELSTED